MKPETPRIRHYQTAARREELLSEVNPLIREAVKAAFAASNAPLYLQVDRNQADPDQDTAWILNNPPEDAERPHRGSYYF